MSPDASPRDRFDALLAQHLDGRLDAEGRNELAGLAAEWPELAERLRGQTQLHVLLAESLGGADGGSMVARVLHAHASRGDSTRFVAQVVQQAVVRRTHRRIRRRWWLALAAVVLIGIAIGVVIGTHPAPEAPAFARIVSLEGGTAEIAGRPVQPGDAWPVGSTLALADPVRMGLRLNDGSLVSATGARLAGAEDGGIRLDLSLGRIEVTVAKQTPGRTFKVVTAQAQVSAVGTRFVIEVVAAATRIEVLEGRVVTVASGQRSELVAGDRAEASSGRLQVTPYPRRIEVVFGAEGTPLPAGALLDQAKAWDAVRGYGWDGDPDEIIAIPLTKGLIHGKRITAMVNRKDGWGHVSAGQLDEDRWRMRLPPGRYRVTVAVGDPSFPQGEHRVVVEGVTVVDHLVTNIVQQASAEVEVLDGELTMQVGGTRRPVADGSSDTILSRLIIERLER